MTDITILDEIKNNVGYSIGGLFGFITSIIQDAPFTKLAIPGIKLAEYITPHLTGFDFGALPIEQILVFIINPVIYGFIFGLAYIKLFKKKNGGESK